MALAENDDRRARLLATSLCEILRDCNLTDPILRLDCVATFRQGSMSIPSTDCEC